MAQVREYLNDCDKGRFDYEIDEANLTLCNVCCSPVVELTYGELVRLLKVSLCEELHEDQIRPELAQVPRLRRVRDVR